MADSSHVFDTDKFVNPAQIGGIEAYTLDEGPGRGVRALCVNTGGGLRYRVLADRGLDIDQAFFNQHSLAFLSHKAVTPPTRGLDQGLDWLQSFSGGLLTSCGPFHIGAPRVDGRQLGLHGPHSNTAASIESIIQPDPRAGRLEMSITATLRYGAVYGPWLELRRTIRSAMGRNVIDISDEFANVGNTITPHAWLLHINFGYPLLNAGSEFCYSGRVQPRGDADSQACFAPGRNHKRLPQPSDRFSGDRHAVAFIFPKATRDGQATVGVINRGLSLGAAIHYNTRQFPQCGNWQHWGRGEYVGALEPMNGSVSDDANSASSDHLEPGQRKSYRYQIEVVSDREGIARLRALNG